MDAVLIKVLALVVGFVIGCLIVSIVGWVWGLYKHSLNKKRVLKAIKDLDIEEELANCPTGVNAKLFNAIKTYLSEHNFNDPFVGQGSAFDMTLVIAELREKGKVKPVYDNLMSLKKKKSDGHKNAVMLRKVDEMK